MLPTNRQGEAPRRGSKVLVYDSRPADLVATLVERGYSVVVARSLEDLEVLAVRERPDLVLGDFNANGNNPVAACRRLQANLLIRHIPLIVVAEDGSLERRVAVVNSGADDYVVEPYEVEELVARIERSVRRARISLDANPLTRLPGNASIKAEIARRLEAGETFAVLFVDIDNFKAFNDRYGFERGDEALRVAADMFLHAVEELGNGLARDFVGNIGGDDFVVITTTERAEPLAARICQLGAERLPLLCDSDDRKAGYITSRDRQGRLQRFPLMAVSVAIVTNEDRTFTHHSEFSQVGSEIKAYLKERGGRRYMKNRRRAPQPTYPLPDPGQPPDWTRIRVS